MLCWGVQIDSKQEVEGTQNAVKFWLKVFVFFQKKSFKSSSISSQKLNSFFMEVVHLDVSLLIGRAIQSILRFFFLVFICSKSLFWFFFFAFFLFYT